MEWHCLKETKFPTRLIHEAFHLHFDWYFDYFSVKWDWKQEFLKMEGQVSVRSDWPVKEDQLWRWTTFSKKFPPGLKRSIYVSTEISRNFGIMESTLSSGLYFSQVFASHPKRFVTSPPNWEQVHLGPGVSVHFLRGVCITLNKETWYKNSFSWWLVSGPKVLKSVLCQ